jgi:hypothetical protein
MGSTARIDKKTLRRRIRDSGGVVAALDYGVRSEQIDDPRLATAWGEAERLYTDLSRAVSRIQRELRTAA